MADYPSWRTDAGDVAMITVRGEISVIRQLMKYCERIGILEPDAHERVYLPDTQAGSRTEAISAERFDHILDYLERYEYCTMKHIVYLLWRKAGLRIGALRSLDVGHVHLDERALELEHRPERDLPLKNKSDSERFLAIGDDTADVLDDWISGGRPDVTLDGVEPLLATRQGTRMSLSGLRDIAYLWTRPCATGEPICDDCSEHQYGSTCPESYSPHALRRSALTAMLGDETPKEIVSERSDTSVEVLDTHYNQLTEREKMERRREFLSD
jgi:integrase